MRVVEAWTFSFNNQWISKIDLIHDIIRETHKARVIQVLVYLYGVIAGPVHLGTNLTLEPVSRYTLDPFRSFYTPSFFLMSKNHRGLGGDNLYDVQVWMNYKEAPTFY